jgi:hypothetical protein
MAISPELLEDNLLEECDTIENYLDAKLACHKITVGHSVHVGIPDIMCKMHLNEIRSRYLDSGWTNVEWSVDDDYLIFYY